MGSHGSVIPFFWRDPNGVLPITSPSMTRFNTSERAWRWCCGHWRTPLGELRPRYLVGITDVAEAIGPSCEKPIIGIRPGEKIHEEMITAADSFTTIDLGPYYAILPSDGRVQQIYKKAGISCTPVPNGMAYNSGSNPKFLNVDQLRALILEHVDPAFVPV